MGWGKSKPRVEELRTAPQPVEPVSDEWVQVSTPSIGKSLHVQGEVTGRENVTIDGSVDGKISLDEHTLTVGTSAVIRAEIHARSVIISGKVIGNVHADDCVEITSTGSLQGNIVAARVVLMDNARFRGNIETGGDWSAEAPATATRTTTSRPVADAPQSTAVDVAKLAEASKAADANKATEPARATDAGKADRGSLLKAINWGDSQLKK